MPQDNYYSHPIQQHSRWSRGGQHSSSQWDREREKQRLVGQSSSTTSTATNGNSPHSHSRNLDRLGRTPICSQNGADMNGDLYIVERPSITDSSAQSSRRSSFSSSRAGHSGKKTTVEQCFKLKEREQYLKLLQQHTTVDLGYHNNHSVISPSHLVSVNNEHQAHRTLETLQPETPKGHSNVLSVVKSDKTQTSRYRAAPSRVLQATSVLETVDDSALSSKSRSMHDIFIVPRVPGKTMPIHSTPLPRKGQQYQNCPQAISKEKAIQRPESDRPLNKSNTGQTSRPPVSLDFKSSEYLNGDWLSKMSSKYEEAERERKRLIKEAEAKKKLLEERRESRLGNLDKKLREQMRLFDEEQEVIEETPLPKLEEETKLPELTEEMERVINKAFDGGPPTQILSEAFRLQIRRSDIATLHGLNWLNDEVINFYMNLLMERGQQQGFPKVYAFNTFFYPKLTSGGHAAVKRWTRRIDIFSHHYLIMPVHLGVHWCLCVVFMKDKKICYYDSMGGNNDQCLNAVRQYLYDESKEKRNVELDLSEWTTEIIKDIPQQMNGSDCGMFSCMYAECITRGAKITFSQICTCHLTTQP
ncbi:hypothetical protein C0Q70_09997 [Pomacea canaliculata]|uniref:Ubiquitin-like protease family profile domain-containing protein n=1 Tax=Pomacea canaliculata TaxID=400727 RepID=A0A2T7PBE1_POMCA|nr:hypothetical protein C0Q70_09997 [Pomacea canaliculata]